MYRVMRYDFLEGWRYFNTYSNYADAAEAVLRFSRQFGGEFKIFAVD